MGVQSRNFANDRIYAIGWKSGFPPARGLALTYPWIETQVAERRSRA